MAYANNIPSQRIKTWVLRHFPDAKERHDELVIVSPFRNDGKYKFNISLTKGQCHDWRGDSWAGETSVKTSKRNCSFFNFVRLYLGCSYIEAVKSVMGDSANPKDFLYGKPEDDETPLKTVEVELPSGLETIHDATDVEGRAIRKWLMKRGYTLEMMEEANLQHIGMEVYWPYYEYGEMVYWQSRSRMNKIYRFPNVKVYGPDGKIEGQTEVSKGDFIYGFDDIKAASYMILTESIFGKITIGDQAGATGGASVTDEQKQKVKLIGPKDGIILSPDNDKAGVESLSHNYAVLRPLGYKMYYTLPPKMPYMKDGKQEFTKDYNELIELCGLSRSEVRKIHDESITQLNDVSLLKLRVASVAPDRLRT